MTRWRTAPLPLRRRLLVFAVLLGLTLLLTSAWIVAEPDTRARLVRALSQNVLRRLF